MAKRRQQAKQRRRTTMMQRSRAKSPSEKATYHQLTGAGRRHVKRQFFGLSEREEEHIFQLIQEHLEGALGEE